MSEAVIERPDAAVRSSAAVRVPRFTACVYGLAIVGTEAALVAWGPLAGTVIESVLLVVMLSHFTLLTPEVVQGRVSEGSFALVRALPVLALLPLLRVLSLTMPAQQVSQLYWYAMVAGPLLLGIALAVRLLGISAADIGFRRTRRLPQLAIALSGIPLGIAAYELTRPHALVARGDVASLIAGVIILVVGTGFTEEILFRGLVQRATTELFGRLGMPAASALFAAMYVGTLSVRYVAFILALGVFYGWCRQRTHSLWGVSLSHGLLNVLLLIVLPLALQ
jgi:membrane protease YdiL (CAAX protease family)